MAESRDAHFGGNSYEASMLRNLLALIHRDGGHYIAQHGLEKALSDAEERVSRWLTREAEVKPVAWPFARSPGAVAAELYTSLAYFNGDMIAAVREVFIERGEALAAKTT